MSNIKILVLGHNAGMMQNVMVFLGRQGFTKRKVVLTSEEMFSELVTGRYDVLIIGGGEDNESRKAIRHFLDKKNIPTKIVEHFGNPSSLPDEIRNALSAQ